MAPRNDQLHEVLSVIFQVARDQRQWTKEQLAEHAGLSRETLSRIGKRGTADFETIARLAKAIGYRLAAVPDTRFEAAIVRGENVLGTEGAITEQTPDYEEPEIPLDDEETGGSGCGPAT